MELKKAKNQQQKLERINSILNSAEQLFANGDKELPSVIEIANKSGIAKGTVYLYFTTKESIFLTLVERHIQQWLMNFESLLRQYEAVTVNDVCNYITQYWNQTPSFGQLVRLSDAVLENRVDSKVYANFHTRKINEFKRLSPAFKELNPQVAGSEWVELLELSYQLLGLAWSQTHPRVNLQHKSNTFSQQAEKLLTPYWQSLVTYEKPQVKPKSAWRKILGN